MQLNDFFSILGRRIWVILTTFFVTMSVVVAGTYYLQPTYTAVTTLRISTTAISAGSTDYVNADRLINTYINIVTSNPILDELNKQMGLAKSPAIDVVNIPNTELIQISVEDHNPVQAALAANTLTKILIGQSNDFYAGSGKSPLEILSDQIAVVEQDLIQARKDYADLLMKTPSAVDQISTASKALDVKQQIYANLVQQYEQTRVRETIQANAISIVAPAVVPTKPSKPNILVNYGLGLIASLVGGFGLAFLFENLDTTLYTSDQIEAVSGMNSIGRITMARNKKEKMLPLKGFSVYVESFLHLRTNLLALDNKIPLRTLMVTSAEPSEGKSTIASTLAYVFAEAGNNVILIDCDLRLPRIDKVFKLPNEVGLSDYLKNQVGLEKIIRKTDMPGISIITSGERPINPSELLGSSRMYDLIQILKKHYSMIIIDTPSILAVTDTSILIPYFEAVLLVAARGGVHRDKLLSACRQLRGMKPRISGLVINNENHMNVYDYHYHREK
jgi:succinoglycan biosynthesis transport protein ExoP